MTHFTRPITYLATTLLLVACTAAPPANRNDGDGADATDGPSTGVGPGISVEDALTSTLDQPLLVNGFLVAGAEGDEEVHLCSSLAESDPPQCGEPSIHVEGLDLSTVQGLTTRNGVTWSEDAVQLLGRIGNGVLTIEEGATP